MIRPSSMNQNRYLDWLLATTSETVRSWLGDEALLASMRDEFSGTIIERTDTADWGERYARACPWPGAVAKDYCLRELQLPDGLSVLAGIHFYGSLKRFRFVGVFAQSRQIAAGELPQLVEGLLGEFAVFEPTCVQLWCSGEPGETPPFGSASRVVGDNRFIVGNLTEIHASPLPGSPADVARVSIEADGDLSSYQRYCEIYEAFFADHPQWRGRLEIETRESLEACAERGGLYRALIDGKFAGLIAAKPSRHRGVSGWLMIDEVLAKPFRGRGFAPILQRKFLKQLDPGINQLVMGTIDNENRPSLGTARRCGRIDAGGDVFVHP